MIKIYDGNLEKDLQWVSFTPTGSWTTNTTYTHGFYRLVGNTMQYQVRLSLSGAPNATTLTVNLPPGFTLDTSKFLSGRVPVGTCNSIDSGTNWYRFIIAADTSSPSIVTPYTFSISGSNVIYGTINATTPWVWTTSDDLQFQCEFPVTF